VTMTRTPQQQKTVPWTLLLEDEKTGGKLTGGPMDFFSYSNPDARLSEEKRTAAIRPLLRELSDEDLDSLDQFAAALRFATGSRIIAVGEHSDALLIIVSGSVRLTTGASGQHEQRVDDLADGEVFGISSFLDGEASAINAIALESTELLALRRTSFEQLAAWKPALALALIQDIAAYASRRLRQLQVSC